ncbi:2-succinyl-5-enolpyruvyl-6-hydroxy-3-cyclohexene-1-carboxylate synthase [Micropruina sp.]|uniref:2-succinyl-5-enolpyruvyl-6-hydroxy-3- cyclohexene-1-carboxylate synthase n=1 Tax=Micropruina sp. TaxID=2737536 RepID=UPI0039E2F9B7
MYSSKKNVQILVASLKQHGIKHAVISPGSRNMAIVASIERDPEFTCYSVVDERSAVYFAIGVSLAQNAPVMLSCTSAQATRNYIPGMTEAYYRGTPLVVVTADYRPSQIGQGVMQAMDQLSIPKDSAKISVGLPLVQDADDEAYCNRLVNEALLELTHHGPGPVHINIPIEEHWNGGVATLPPVRKIDRYAPFDALPVLRNRRIMVSVGAHLPFSPSLEAALGAFAIHYDAVVYTNHLSNYHGPNAVNASLLVTNIGLKHYVDYQPDLLITIGGQIGDYDFDGMMRRLPIEHWRVHQDGVVRDTYGKLSKVFEFPEQEFFSAFLAQGEPARSPAYADLWAKGNAERTIPQEIPLSHAYVAAELAPRIPAGSVMHFAILSAFRNWSFFELDPSIEAYSNVAAFGIDGCLSTFIGHSSATDQLCFLVIGDLSFFYDMSAIGIRGVKSNARIILVNNAGGGEFRLYSNAADSNFGEGADRHIAAAGHHGSAQAWVESMDWGYIAVRSKQDLVENADWLLQASDRPLLIEVFTTMQDDSDGVRIIREANTIESLEKKIAKMLPPRVKRVAKAVLGR